MNATLVFLDCEFTGFEADALLISAGLLLEDGGEFYAELSPQSVDFDEVRRRAGAFVHETVLPLLQRVPGCSVPSYALMAERVCAWLADIPGTVAIVHDYPKDYLLLEDLLRLSPPGSRLVDRLIPAYCNGDLTGSAPGRDSAQACWNGMVVNRGLARHHALADAHALKAAFDASRPALVRYDTDTVRAQLRVPRRQR